MLPERKSVPTSTAAVARLGPDERRVDGRSKDAMIYRAARLFRDRDGGIDSFSMVIECNIREFTKQEKESESNKKI